jgi:aryl-alcohol dehydrogenase-like predicted oxidoreductase
VNIKYRKLGNTGFDVSTISFGTWQIGGGRWKTSDTKENVNLLRQAQELGINLFDAAVVYGQYRDSNSYLQSHSQELLGSAFQDKRDQVYYCIKLGQFDEFSHRALFEPGRVVEQFQQSLRRLRTDYIDICLIHAPTLHEVQRGSAIAIVKTLQALGLVRAVGYSFENEPYHARAAIRQGVDVIMLQYNLLDRQCREVIGLAQKYGVGIIVGGPFKRGYLSGKYKSIEDLPVQDDDYWKWNIEHNPHKVSEILARVNEIADESVTPLELRQMALGFILQEEGVASTVVGHRSVEEIKENIQISMEIK